MYYLLRNLNMEKKARKPSGKFITSHLSHSFTPFSGLRKIQSHLFSLTHGIPGLEKMRQNGCHEYRNIIGCIVNSRPPYTREGARTDRRHTQKDMEKETSYL